MKFDIENWPLAGQIGAIGAALFILPLLIIVLVTLFAGIEFSWVDYIALIGGFAGLTGGIAAILGYLKIFKKVAMISSIDQMNEILPIWFNERMNSDHWGFGILTASNTILAISSIKGISSDKQWLHVELIHDDFDIPDELNGVRVIKAISNDRQKADVQISQIVCALELVTS